MAQNTPAAVDSIDINQEINLEQAIQIALANNTQLKQAVLSIDEADQQIRTAWSQVMPDIALSADYTRNLEVPVNFLPEIVFDPNGDPDALIPVAFGTDNNWSGGLAISQTLFSGQAFVGISSADLYKTAQSESLRATSQGVVTQTRLTYYQVLLAKEQLRLIEAQIERINSNLDDTRKRAEQGFADDYAVLQLEVQQSNLEPQRTSAEFAIDNAVRELLDVMGLPVHLTIGVTGNLNSFDIHSTTASSEENEALKTIDRLTQTQVESDPLFTQDVLEYRGDIRVLDIQKQLQEKQLSAQRSNYLPTLSANYNLNWSASQAGRPVFFGTEQTRARSQTILLNLRFPIFQGFSRDAAVQTAKIEMKDLEVQEYQTQQTATKEILATQQSILEAYETSEARNKALEQAEIGYDRALARYQSGVGTQQEVTDADLQLREAENNYAQMVLNYLSAKAEYDQAIGQVPYIGQNTESINNNIELN
ncbi:MAG: TolC family protein [Balneolaceae bacterium]